MFNMFVTNKMYSSNADMGATDATSLWWSLGGADMGRARECIQSLT